MSAKPIALLLVLSTILYAVASAQSVLIPVPDRRDHVFDPSRGILCISTARGVVERYDVTTQSLLSPIPAGTALRGLDITPDSAFLYATDEGTSGGSGFVRKVNLASLAVTNLPFALESSEGGSYDIAIANNGKALFTTSGGAGREFPVREILLASDSMAVRTDIRGFFDYHIEPSTDVYRGASRSYFYFTTQSCSLGIVFDYRAATDDSPDSVEFSRCLGPASVNRMGTRIAAYLGPLNGEPDPAGLYGVSSSLFWDNNPITRRLNGGVLLDPARDVLYAIDAVNDQLVALDAATHAELYRADVGEDVGRVQEQRNGVTSMSDDGRYFFLSTPSGIRMFDLNPPNLACRAGNVNASAGQTADVLTINGSAGADAHRTVTVQPGQSFTLALAAPPGGPAAPNYLVWAWRTSETNAQTLVIDGSTIGCVVNPTPYHVGLVPQPIRCLRGSGLSPDGCAGVSMPPSPPAAPWSRTLPRGLPAPALFQLQGVIQDATAPNGAGLSMTNAVFLRIR